MKKKKMKNENEIHLLCKQKLRVLYYVLQQNNMYKYD